MDFLDLKGSRKINKSQVVTFVSPSKVNLEPKWTGNNHALVMKQRRVFKIKNRPGRLDQDEAEAGSERKNTICALKWGVRPGDSSVSLNSRPSALLLQITSGRSSCFVIVPTLLVTGTLF